MSIKDILEFKHTKEKFIEFSVPGLGKIGINNNPQWRCGGEKGFRFETDSYKFKDDVKRFCGGVIGQKESFRLAFTIIYYLMIYYILFPFNLIKNFFITGVKK